MSLHEWVQSGLYDLVNNHKCYVCLLSVSLSLLFLINITVTKVTNMYHDTLLYTVALSE